MNQVSRDTICIVTLGLALLAYHQLLLTYLSALSNPTPLLFAFWGSLALSALHVASKQSKRLTLLRATALAVSFCLGVLIAIPDRLWYAGMVAEFAATPEIMSYFGPDYGAAITNKAFGYGGCFALGILLIKWLATQRIEQLVIRLFSGPGAIPLICEHCNQPLSDNHDTAK